jgi:hypothetical protein
MKAICNFKVWEKGNFKRIYVGGDAYLDKGATGLVNGHGLSGEDSTYLYDSFMRMYKTMDFDVVYQHIKELSKNVRAARKAKKAS